MKSDDRILKLKETIHICGKGRSSIYEAINKGEFPSQIKIGRKAVGWLKSEIDEWLEKQVQSTRMSHNKGGK